ncbi:hypothetical protein WME79_15190 [Sorangium sp. So ce726]
MRDAAWTCVISAMKILSFAVVISALNAARGHWQPRAAEGRSLDQGYR